MGIILSELRGGIVLRWWCEGFAVWVFEEGDKGSDEGRWA